MSESENIVLHTSIEKWSKHNLNNRNKEKCCRLNCFYALFDIFHSMHWITRHRQMVGTIWMDLAVFEPFIGKLHLKWRKHILPINTHTHMNETHNSNICDWCFSFALTIFIAYKWWPFLVYLKKNTHPIFFLLSRIENQLSALRNWIIALCGSCVDDLGVMLNNLLDQSCKMNKKT